MANNENKLSHLKMDNNSYPDLDKLFDTQASLQKFISKNLDITDITEPLINVKTKVEWLLKNKHAFDDEFSEMLDAVGGINDGIGSAGWKWWKIKNKDTALHNGVVLTPEDLLELKFEYIDMLHFFINMGIILGLNGSEVMNLYMAKNKENIERQKRGY